MESTPSKSQKGPVRWQWTVIVLAIFLASFLLRAYQPASRASHWYDRSRKFYSGIAEREWKKTWQSHHPGVTVMWIGGAGVKMFDALIDSGVNNPVVRAVVGFQGPPGLEPEGRRMNAGITMLALAISLLTVLDMLLIRRIWGRALAVATGGFLAFSPFYLSLSRAFHLDALLAAFMLASALALFVFMIEGRWEFMALSGVLGGLGILTKSPGVFMFLFAGLSLGYAWLLGLIRGWKDGDRGVLAILGGMWRQIFAPLVVWIVAAALMTVIWPAFLTKPDNVIGSMIDLISTQLEKPHRNRFFAGTIYVNETPPPSYYPVTIAYLLSFASSIFIVVALIGNVIGWVRTRLPIRPRYFWLMVAFVGFYVLQMGIGAKYSHRYIMPAVIALEFIAAVGVVWFASLIQMAIRTRMWWVTGIVVAVGVGLQALSALPYAPDYGAHYNHLLGGNPGAMTVLEVATEVEGIAQTGAYLREVVGNGHVIGITNTSTDIVGRYYQGEVTEINEPEAEYYLFFLRDLIRDNYYYKWGYTWEEIKTTEPLFQIRYDGVPYIYLYPADAEAAADLPHITIDKGATWLIEWSKIIAAMIAVIGLAAEILVWLRIGPLADARQVIPEGRP